MLEIPPNVLCRELDGELFVVNAQTGYYFTLNEVGGRMWRALARHGGVERALEELRGEYDVEADRLRGDLSELAARLCEHGLLQEAGAPPDDR